MITPDVSPRVLLVEDNDHTIEIVTVLLDDLSMTDLVIMPSYHDFHTWLHSAPKAITLALIDLQLPDADADGYRVLTDLRRYPLFATTPLIAFTAHVFSHDIACIQAAGFHGCIEKPIHHGRFKEAIQQIVSGRTAWLHVGHPTESPASMQGPADFEALLTTQRSAFCMTEGATIESLCTQWRRIHTASHPPLPTLAAMQRTLHPLTGHAAQLGFRVLSQRLRQMHTMVRIILMDPTEWTQQRVTLTQLVDQLHTHLPTLMETPPAWEHPA